MIDNWEEESGKVRLFLKGKPAEEIIISSIYQLLQEDLQSVITMLAGNTPRKKIANYIKEYLLGGRGGINETETIRK